MLTFYILLHITKKKSSLAVFRDEYLCKKKLFKTNVALRQNKLEITPLNLKFPNVRFTEATSPKLGHFFASNLQYFK